MDEVIGVVGAALEPITLLPAVLRSWPSQSTRDTSGPCRIDAIKNKQASRRDAGGPDPAAAPATGTGPGSHRVFSKHVAIPVGHGGVGGSRAGSTAGSQQGTPFGSPKRHEPLLDAAGAALPPLEVPPIWLGYQASCWA